GTISVTSANSISTPLTINPSSTPQGQPEAGVLATISVRPPIITGGQPATGTVTLANPAGANGVSVGLSSTIPSVSVPATVTLPPGSPSADFAITTLPVTVAAEGRVIATSANTLSTPVSVDPSAGTPLTGTVASLSIAPQSITGGQPATGTVTLASPA